MAARSRAVKRAAGTDKARARLNGRELVFSLSQGQANRFDVTQWRRFVAMAAEFGATHIEVGWLPFRYGTWFLPDNRDPYASWCNCGLGLFRAFPPPALREWVPLTEARAVQAILRAQVAELRRHGLKGVVNGCEPLWLPEGVYHAHPHWRGAQCELGRIARRPYFAPSIDEPEVLELYRQAMHQLAAGFPEIDQLSFMANDSGSGLSWAPCIYPGMNGPARWRTRDPGERLAHWLEALQDGAAEAGAKVRVNAWSSGLPSAWVAATRARLRPGLFLNWGNHQGESFAGATASLGGGLWDPAYPALGVADPPGFLNGLQQVFNNPAADRNRVSISFGPDRLELARAALETVLANPGAGTVHAARLQMQLAERLTGSPEAAERLAGAWENVRLALHAMRQVTQKGFSIVLPWTCVSMRWLIRPLVPRPQLLTADETARWRPWLFSVNSEAENADFGTVLGKTVFKGEAVVWMTRWTLHGAIARLHAAQATLRQLADSADPARAAELKLGAARIGACACLAATVKNTVMYQYALDTARHPQYGPNMMDYDDNIIYDQRALALRKIAREELDNTAELLALLRESPGPILEHARHDAEQSVFMLGPELLADLEDKLAVMMNHWQDYERLFPTTRMRDFEPDPEPSAVNDPALQVDPGFDVLGNPQATLEPDTLDIPF
ncbi:MAG: hypothetical protein BWZ02_01140 [Lentisphaerae bacterium ADurb.BinA184]|nr:MAG: hypothetical protein BWZ02_01140 [Lentisphaerae bacterium ADurb.BinA184]